MYRTRATGQVISLSLGSLAAPRFPVTVGGLGQGAHPRQGKEGSYSTVLPGLPGILQLVLCGWRGSRKSHTGDWAGEVQLAECWLSNREIQNFIPSITQTRHGGTSL